MRETAPRPGCQKLLERRCTGSDVQAVAQLEGRMSRQALVTQVITGLGPLGYDRFLPVSGGGALGNG